MTSIRILTIFVALLRFELNACRCNLHTTTNHAFIIQNTRMYDSLRQIIFSRPEVTRPNCFLSYTFEKDLSRLNDKYFKDFGKPVKHLLKLSNSPWSDKVNELQAWMATFKFNTFRSRKEGMDEVEEKGSKLERVKRTSRQTLRQSKKKGSKTRNGNWTN